MSLSNRGGRRSSQRLKGFTLVELLVVLTLMGLVLGLVGPLSVDSFERMKSQDEVLELKHLLRLASADAFLGSRWTALLVLNDRLEVRAGDQLLRGKTFSYLSFPEQRVSLSPQGLPDQERLAFLRRGQAESLEFKDLLHLPQGQEGALPDG